MNYYKSSCPVFSSSEGLAYEIFLSGCHGYCEGCHSPHTWDFDAGTPIDGEFMDKLISDLKDKERQYDNIVILGGEPLDHPTGELLDFLRALSESFADKKIYLYTHFYYEDVPEKMDVILPHLDYVKVGGYEANKLNKEKKKDSLVDIALASTNQYFVEGKRNGLK